MEKNEWWRKTQSCRLIVLLIVANCHIVNGNPFVGGRHTDSDSSTPRYLSPALQSPSGSDHRMHHKTIFHSFFRFLWFMIQCHISIIDQIMFSWFLCQIHFIISIVVDVVVLVGISSSVDCTLYSVFSCYTSFSLFPPSHTHYVAGSFCMHDTRVATADAPLLYTLTQHKIILFRFSLAAWCRRPRHYFAV